MLKQYYNSAAIALQHCYNSTKTVLQQYYNGTTEYDNSTTEAFLVLESTTTVPQMHSFYYEVLQLYHRSIHSTTEYYNSTTEHLKLNGSMKPVNFFVFAKHALFKTKS